ncbi:MAG: carboxypeptidase regulatory-like domain-containing protein [Acidobacteriota bacterium]|nr:carboxypeptidase regulatory-like domain-containing protein [Acidobacteriota bacterium]
MGSGNRQKRILVPCALLGVLLAACSGLSIAQQVAAPAAAAQAANAASSSITVHGNITDPDDAVIPGATVTLTPTSGKAILVTSQSDGSYMLRGVPAGTYNVTVTMPGFASYVKQGLHLTTGQSLTINVKLAIQAESQVVQVNASAAEVSVDSDSNASSTVIKGKDLEALSDDPDELSSELQALAGPAAGPNGGQIYVDGFTNGQLPPKSSIREIRINQNPFSAQYDRLGFGRVEVFTKPGTDKYHGNFSFQFGDKALNTSNPFLGATNSQPSYHTIFAIGNISGPINHFSSFTIGGSHRNIQDNNIINPGGFYASSATATTPCAPGDLSCSYFASLPATARAIPHPQSRSDVSPRVDVALGEKNTLTMRYQYYSNSQSNGGVGGNALASVGVDSSNSENELQVSDTQIFSAKVINETRFEVGRDTSSTTPQDSSPTLLVQGAFVAGGNSGGASSSHTNYYELQNYTSIALAKNFIRLGGRLRGSTQTQTSYSGLNGTLTYTSLLDPCTSAATATSGCQSITTTPCAAVNASVSSYQCGIPSLFSQATINKPTFSGNSTDVGLYAEDDWKPRQNLTLSLGMRYEAQNIIHSTHDIAPRFSFAYGIPRKGKSPVTVVRGGYGIFYDRFNLGTYLNTVQNNGTNQVTLNYRTPGPTCQPGNLAGCSGSLQQSGVTTYTLGNNLRTSYTLQAALGFDQQLGRAATLSVNFLAARGIHEFMSREYYNTTLYNFQYQSAGVFRQDQLMVNGNARLNKVSLFGFYSLSFANANTSGAGFVPTSNTNTRLDYGRAAFARRSFGVMGGNVSLRYGFSLSPFLIAQSGTPYNLTTGLDPLGTSVYSNERPYFANGTSGDCRNAADFSETQTGALTEVPINYCTGPANVSFNLRVARVFGFGPKTGPEGGPGGPGGPPRGGPGGPGGGPGGGRGGGPMMFGGGSSGHRYTLNIGAQAFNLFNMVPYGSPTSVLNSPRFGQVTSLSSGPFSSATAVRRITLQASFNF